MPDIRPEIKAAWILGGLTLAGVLLTIVFSGPSVQQNTKGHISPAINNTGGNVIINSPNQQEKKADD